MSQAQIEKIKAQTLDLIEEITLHPKPSYMIDGQSIQWSAYLTNLKDTVTWCNQELSKVDQVEVISRGIT